MDVGANLGRVDNTVLFYEHVITNVEREKSDPFAKLLEGWPDDAAALHHAVPPHPHVRQVAADDAVVHDYRLAVEDDVLAATQHRLPAHLVARCFSKVVQLYCVMFSLGVTLLGVLYACEVFSNRFQR